MFIRKIKTPQGTEYFHLVESYREKGKVRQRTLLPLGRTTEGKLSTLAQAVSRHTNYMSLENLAKNLEVKKTFILGPLLILQKLFEKLGVNKAIEQLPKNPKTSYDVQKTLFALAARRFVDPGSKLKMFESLKDFYPGLMLSDIKLHQIYRVLDVLANNKDRIEHSLYWHGRDLFNYQVDVVLYDLTTLRFESHRTDLGKLRRFGYSKEKRGDMVQCILALLVDKEGLPLGFEVYPGNTFEGSSVKDIEQKMREKFQVRRFIFVGDRGLFSLKNLKAFDQGEGEFIIGMRLGLVKNRHKEFYDHSRFKVLNAKLKVYETVYDSKRLIITWSAVRAERDRKAREKILKKIEEKLEKSKKKAGKKAGKSGRPKKPSAKDFVSNESYKKYIILKEEEPPRLNREAIEEEEKRDGFFGVVTNVRDMTAMDLVSQYKELWRVEDAFGELKGTLKARPVFHWTDQRIVGHLMMCFIAYLCEAYLSKELRRNGFEFKSKATEGGVIKRRPLTVVEGMRALREVRAIPVEVKGSVIWIRTEIEGNASKMFRAAGVQIPRKLLPTPEKTAF